MQSQKILLLLVNYFNEEETKSFIEEQVLKQTEKRYDIVIAINGCNNPEILSELEKLHQNIFICNCGSNIGYLPGAAFGLRNYLLKVTGEPEYVIISNCDMEIPDPDFFRNLIETSGSLKYDILGPDIQSSLFNQHQNPYIPERISVMKMKILGFLTSNTWLYNLFLLYYFAKTWMFALLKMNGKSLGTIRNVYGIHGSFMVFRNTFFRKGGSFDSPLTLYGEEIFIAELALGKNMTVIFEPSLKIIHHEHSTTRVFKSRKSVQQLHSSYLTLVNRRIVADKLQAQRYS
jgi:GT2 family glycosyltransferase